jgi:23S rRNA (adenine2503-C2)-methyltransferase
LAVPDNFKKYSLSEAKEIMAGLGLDSYRAEQIFKWLWQRGTRDFSAMTNISKQWRDYLGRNYTIQGPLTVRIRHEGKSARKYLMRLEDGAEIESVFIREAQRRTVCVSTQVGCPLGCKFCATALIGFKRNLFAHEIAGQVQVIQESVKEKCTNVVFMGMGEPLLNTDGLFRALEIMNSSIGLSIGRRHTTVSTAGLIEGIEMLLRSPFRVKLAISLNFADDDLRREYMPVACNNPLSEIVKLARVYSKQKEMVTFEYVMIKGVNDSIRDAQNLIRLLRGIPAKINLIPLNEFPGLPYKGPTEQSLKAFFEKLLTSAHTVVIRKSRGQKILAGCGQLAGSARDDRTVDKPNGP